MKLNLRLHADLVTRLDMIDIGDDVFNQQKANGGMEHH